MQAKQKIESRLTLKQDISLAYLKITEVILRHCNVVINSYQQNSRVLYIFAPNKSFGQLLYISPEKFIFLKTFDSECLYIEVQFTDKNSDPLEKEEKINTRQLLSKV